MVLIAALRCPALEQSIVVDTENLRIPNRIKVARRAGAMLVGKEPIAAPKLDTGAPELIATATEILTLPYKM